MRGRGPTPVRSGWSIGAGRQIRRTDASKDSGIRRRDGPDARARHRRHHLRIFSVVQGVLLRPLPFDNPDRLVQVFGRVWGQDHDGVPDPLTGPVGSPELEQFEKDATLLDGLAGYEVTTRHLSGADGPERLTAVMTDLTFFSVLGARARTGQTCRALILSMSR